MINRWIVESVQLWKIKTNSRVNRFNLFSTTTSQPSWRCFFLSDNYRLIFHDILLVFSRLDSWAFALRLKRKLALPSVRYNLPLRSKFSFRNSSDSKDEILYLVIGYNEIDWMCEHWKAGSGQSFLSSRISCWTNSPVPYLFPLKITGWLVASRFAHPDGDVDRWQAAVGDVCEEARNDCGENDVEIGVVCQTSRSKEIAIRHSVTSIKVKTQ